VGWLLEADFVKSTSVTTMSTSEPCLQNRTGVLDY